MITEDMIINAGLYPYKPWQLEEFPKSLHKHCGRGIGLWQYPNQFAPYLNKVLENDPRSYLEIGVGAGGTFAFTSQQILKKPSRGCFAVDIAPAGEVNYMNNEDSPYIGKLNEFLLTHPQCAFYQGTSASFFKEVYPFEIDYVLIDGDHSYQGVKDDWAVVKDRARIIGFHDIANQKTPGVITFWEEVKNNRLYHAFEYKQQYEEGKSFLGLGLLIRKDKA